MILTLIGTGIVLATGVTAIALGAFGTALSLETVVVLLGFGLIGLGLMIGGIATKLCLPSKGRVVRVTH
jgi:hypothetical protein